jgi:ADP-heptose:LPS heptosyltransferase
MQLNASRLEAGGGSIDIEVQQRYARRYAKQERAFRILDWALSWVYGFPRQAGSRTLPVPRKLLIANLGHLGDLIIACSLLPALKQAFPQIEIGLLCGSWNRALVEDNANIDHVHYLDHWYQDRRPISRPRKILRYVRSVRSVVRDLHAERYDIAVDLRPWFPNCIPILWLARIPFRLGYTRVGFGPLLTDALTFQYSRRHERDYQLDLLACLPIDRASLEKLPNAWIVPNPQGRSEVLSLIGHVLPKRYAVLHPGAGIALKNWDEAGWRALAERLLAQGVVPVFTGLGHDQLSVIARITSGLADAVNGCNRLSWHGLVALVAGAEITYSVDTSVGHIAAACGVTCVAIFGGMQDPAQWRPLGPRTTLVTNRLLCSPCFQKAGCAHLSCLKNITVDEVWLARHSC